MITEDRKHIRFQKLTPEDVWNLAILYAIQTVKDSCDETSDITNKDLKTLVKNLQQLSFNDNES